MTRMRSLYILFFCVAIVAACNSPIRQKTSVATNQSDSSKIETSTQTETETSKAIDNSGSGFQVKNSEQLKNSISTCFGTPMTSIPQSAILSPESSPTASPGSTPTAEPTMTTSPGAEGRVRFLGVGTYQPGEDIIDLEKINLDGPTKGLRTGTAASGLTATYLRSLSIVADVVAHNCDLTRKECTCADETAAQTMLARCLPNVNPNSESSKAVVAKMAAQCKLGANETRKAIASLLSSYAFASAR